MVTKGVFDSLLYNGDMLRLSIELMDENLTMSMSVLMLASGIAQNKGSAHTEKALDRMIAWLVH